MCECSDKIERHVRIRIAPTVRGRKFGVDLMCDGTVKVIGDYVPDDETALLWRELSGVLRMGVKAGGFRMHKAVIEDHPDRTITVGEAFDISAQRSFDADLADVFEIVFGILVRSTPAQCRKLADWLGLVADTWEKQGDNDAGQD